MRQFRHERTLIAVDMDEQFRVTRRQPKRRRASPTMPGVARVVDLRIRKLDTLDSLVNTHAAESTDPV